MNVQQLKLMINTAYVDREMSPTDDNERLLIFYCNEMTKIRSKLIEKVASDFSLDYRQSLVIIDKELGLDDPEFNQLVREYAKKYKPMTKREKEKMMSRIFKEMDELGL